MSLLSANMDIQSHQIEDHEPLEAEVVTDLIWE